MTTFSKNGHQKHYKKMGHSNTHGEQEEGPTPENSPNMTLYNLLNDSLNIIAVQQVDFFLHASFEYF